MISAREQQDLLAFASANPLQGMPVGVREEMRAAAEVGMRQMSIGRQINRADAIQPFVDRYEDTTGQRMANPETVVQQNRAEAYRRAREQIDQYRRENPDSDLTFPTDEEIERGGIELARGALERQGALAERPGGSTLGRFLGGMEAAMFDPLNVAALPIGGGGRTVATRILGEALVNAGSQAVIEGATAGYREQVQPGSASAGNVLANIAEAAAGGLLFGAVGEGLSFGGRALSRMRQNRTTRDAINVLTREAEIDAANPFPPGAAGEIAHTEALGRAMEDVQAGRAVDVADVTARARASDQFAEIDVGRPGEPMRIRNLDYRHPETGEGILDALERSRKLAEEPTSAIDTPERQALREQVADDLYGVGAARKERIVDIVLGPPAAGKSSIAEPLAAERGALIIDADMAKERLPEFEGGVGAAKVHDESARIVEGDVLNRAMNAGDNIVLPIVGKTEAKVHGLIDELRAEGYDVRLHLVDLPTPKTVERAVRRYAETGRLVPPDYVAGVGGLPRRTFDAILSSGKVGAYAHYSTDVPRGSSPTVLRAEGQASVLRPGGDGVGLRPGDAAEAAIGPRGGSEGPGGRVTPDEAERLTSEQTDLTAKALDTETVALLADEDFDVPDLGIDENGNVVSTRVSARELLKRADDEIAAAAEVEACAIGAGGEV